MDWVKKRKKEKARKGFTLLEVEVSILLLVLALYGMAMFVMNDIKQLSFLENQGKLYAYVRYPAVNNITSVSYSEITSSAPASGANYRVLVSTVNISEDNISWLKATVDVSAPR